jgi:zinc D-Ala-D-Ala carboxypeptidase
MQISKHLNLAEVTRSESAKRLGISNTPTPEHLDNFKVLAEKVFEPIREHFKVPIHISSGYRSKELNQAIKGSLTSQHCEGKAIDIDMDGSGISNSDVFKYIKDNLVFDQLIWEFGGDNNPDWVHVSYNDGKNRKQVLKAQKIKGKATYIPYK